MWEGKGRGEREGKTGEGREGREGTGREGTPIFYCTQFQFSRNMPAIAAVELPRE